MPGSHLPVPGMALLVPVCALLLGIGAAVVVRRHVRNHEVGHSSLWAAAVGFAFVSGPILLRSTLRPVYGHTFVPVNSESRLLIHAVDPLGALATYLLGGSAVGVAALAVYLWYCCRRLSQRDRRESTV